MEKVTWPSGSGTQALRVFVESHLDEIRNGVLLSVDPGSRSAGWALWKKMELVESGEIQSNRDIQGRLCDLFSEMSEIAKDINILAIEKIRGRNSHAYLFWAVGVSIAASAPVHLVEVPSIHWKRLCEKGYLKNDRNDAQKIGQVIMELAREYS